MDFKPVSENLVLFLQIIVTIKNEPVFNPKLKLGL